MRSRTLRVGTHNLVKGTATRSRSSAIPHPYRCNGIVRRCTIVIFYGRWLKNTDKGVQQTQILVQDDRENGGTITVTTIRDGSYLGKEAKTEAEAMALVADICKRLGGQQCLSSAQTEELTGLS